ncbi:MAG: hypothetical protein ACI8XU_002314, partial [Kiritimatiellia bacterium]
NHQGLAKWKITDPITNKKITTAKAITPPSF